MSPAEEAVNVGIQHDNINFIDVARKNRLLAEYIAAFESLGITLDEVATGEAMTLKTQTTDFSSVQLLDLENTAVEVIPAPASNKVVIPVSIISKYTPGLVPYTETNDPVGLLFWDTVDGVADPLMEGWGASFLISDVAYIATNIIAKALNSIPNLKGKSMKIQTPDTTFYEDGDGTVQVIAIYFEIPVD